MSESGSALSSVPDSTHSQSPQANNEEEAVAVQDDAEDEAARTRAYLIEEGYINAAGELIEEEEVRGKRVTRSAASKRQASREPEVPLETKKQKVDITITPAEDSRKDMDLSRQPDQEEGPLAAAGPSIQTDIFGFPQHHLLPSYFVDDPLEIITPRDHNFNQETPSDDKEDSPFDCRYLTHPTGDANGVRISPVQVTLWNSQVMVNACSQTGTPVFAFENNQEELVISWSWEDVVTYLKSLANPAEQKAIIEWIGSGMESQMSKMAEDYATFVDFMREQRIETNEIAPVLSAAVDGQKEVNKAVVSARAAWSKEFPSLADSFNTYGQRAHDQLRSISKMKVSQTELVNALNLEVVERLTATLERQRAGQKKQRGLSDGQGSATYILTTEFKKAHNRLVAHQTTPMRTITSTELADLGMIRSDFGMIRGHDDIKVNGEYHDPAVTKAIPIYRQLLVPPAPQSSASGTQPPAPEVPETDTSNERRLSLLDARPIRQGAGTRKPTFEAEFLSQSQSASRNKRRAAKHASRAPPSVQADCGCEVDNFCIELIQAATNAKDQSLLILALRDLHVHTGILEMKKVCDMHVYGLMGKLGLENDPELTITRLGARVKRILDDYANRADHLSIDNSNDPSVPGALWYVEKLRNLPVVSSLLRFPVSDTFRTPDLAEVLNALKVHGARPRTTFITSSSLGDWTSTNPGESITGALFTHLEKDAHNKPLMYITEGFLFEFKDVTASIQDLMKIEFECYAHHSLRDSANPYLEVMTHSLTQQLIAQDLFNYVVTMIRLGGDNYNRISVPTPAIYSSTAIDLPDLLKIDGDQLETEGVGKNIQVNHTVISGGVKIFNLSPMTRSDFSKWYRELEAVDGVLFEDFETTLTDAHLDKDIRDRCGLVIVRESVEPGHTHMAPAASAFKLDLAASTMIVSPALIGVGSDSRTLDTLGTTWEEVSLANRDLHEGPRQWNEALFPSPNPITFPAAVKLRTTDPMSALLMGEIKYGTPRAARIMNEFWADPIKAILAQRRASLVEFMRRWGDFVLAERAAFGDRSYFKDHDPV